MVLWLLNFNFHHDLMQAYWIRTHLIPTVGTREFAMGACLEIEFLKLMRPTQQQGLERRRSYYLAVQCYCLWRLDRCSRLFLILKITKYRHKHMICWSLGLQRRGNIFNVLCGVQTERLHCTWQKPRYCLQESVCDVPCMLKCTEAHRFTSCISRFSIQEFCVLST